ncbi:unknown [[Mannheimia] succiniciproducens MBEL55E]|uniref:Uncharacterized protein n=1 Tax=Mannheimia succiniciproducens (strain KCTC 0769BP / MBEL55E) TaxID=221988 RepID=Q65QH1_MANSM|nr:unknown [[Mannheimia] succiniciproducens MBEL55E]
MSANIATFYEMVNAPTRLSQYFLPHFYCFSDQNAKTIWHIFNSQYNERGYFLN